MNIPVHLDTVCSGRARLDNSDTVDCHTAWVAGTWAAARSDNTAAADMDFVDIHFVHTHSVGIRFVRIRLADIRSAVQNPPASVCVSSY